MRSKNMLITPIHRPFGLYTISLKLADRGGNSDVTHFLVFAPILIQPSLREVKYGDIFSLLYCYIHNTQMVRPWIRWTYNEVPH